MPIIDMPLGELRTYKGSSPCPKDIDAFWDRAVAEMEALGTGYELVKSEFQVPGVLMADLYFMGVNGARIHCRFARPEKIDAPLPALCHFHGYSGAAMDWMSMLGYVQAGFVIASMDCRGQGGTSQDVGGVRGNTYKGHIIRGLWEGNPDKLLFRDIFLDTAHLARIMMAMDIVDEKRVGAFGGSQGGALTLACAALTPTLNRAAPQYPFLCDYRRVWDMDLDVNAYEELRDYFRKYDPLHEKEEEIFTLLGYIDNVNLAHRIRAKVKMYTGLMDTICPPSTQFAAYNHMTCEKDVVIYPDFAHEYFPGQAENALQWMMNM